MRALFHLRSHIDLPFDSYWNANPAPKLQSIKFLRIAGASHHQIGNTNMISSAQVIFACICLVISSFHISFLSSYLRKSCLRSVLYKSIISIISQFFSESSEKVLTILWVKPSKLGLADIINLFICNI